MGTPEPHRQGRHHRRLPTERHPGRDPSEVRSTPPRRIGTRPVPHVGLVGAGSGVPEDGPQARPAGAGTGAILPPVLEADVLCAPRTLMAPGGPAGPVPTSSARDRRPPPNFVWMPPDDEPRHAGR